MSDPSAHDPAPPARFPYRAILILFVVLATIVVGGTVVEKARGAQNRAADELDAGPGAAGTCAGQPVSAPRDLRGMWMATVENVDWPSKPGLDEATVKAEYLSYLDAAVRGHHNAIYVHIRPSGDAFWPSAYAPWSEWLTGARDGQGPGWDPLAWMVAETHARNIEFHAWMNPYRGGQPGPDGPGGDITKLAPNHPLRAHPEWAIAYPIGTPGSRLYFDPGIPEARRFVEDSMLEAVAKYDIDGVDFDDFFYPYPEDGQDFNDARSYTLYGNGKNKAQWRRDNVNALVREMSERIHALKPWVTFGISTFGIWRNSKTDPTGSATSGLQSYDEIYVDSRQWVKQHWVDSITPQLYWNIGNAPADYAVLVKWWTDVVKGTGVQLYIAQADYRVGEGGVWNTGELERQLAFNQQYPIDGTVHYNAKTVRRDPLGAITKYEQKYYPTPALIPNMTRLPVNPPATPIIIDVKPGDGGTTVSWRPNTGGPAPTSFAVYRLDPGAAKANLVATARATGNEQSVLDKGAPAGARYCVSGLDRSWHEGLISAAR